MRSLLRSVRTSRQAGLYGYSDGAKARLLLPVALCLALVASSISRDSSPAHWPGPGDYRFAPSTLSLGRRRKELAAATDCGFDRPSDRDNARDIHTSRWVYSLESAHERLERRSAARTISARGHRTSAARNSRPPGPAIPPMPV